MTPTPDQNKCDKDDLCICQKCNAENVFKKSGIDCYGRKLSTPDQREKAIADLTEMYACLNDSDRWHRHFGRIKCAIYSDNISAETLAQKFHETYERLAPSFGYETRKESAKPWCDVPEKNKKLMIAVCAEIKASLTAPPQVPKEAITALKMVLSGKFKSKVVKEHCEKALALLTQGRVK